MWFPSNVLALRTAFPGLQLCWQGASPAAARCPGSHAVSAVRGHAQALGAQTALGLCYLFLSKNQLLLNSGFGSQVSPSLCVQRGPR